MGDPEPVAVREAIVAGERDLAAPAGGIFQDTPSQWHRDATVQLEPITCSGVLVAPNVVLTAAHCVFGGMPTSVRFGIRSDNPTPSNPDALVPVPAGAPVYDAGVIACISHAGSAMPCNSGGTASGIPRNDVAILILDQRVDHGERGTRTQNYNAIPAEIVRADPACPFSGGLRSNVCWTGTEVWHAGFGPTSGCTNPEGSLSRPAVRQARQQTVYVGQWVAGYESAMLLANMHGLHGDSGGPAFSMYEPFDDSRPLQLIGIYTGVYYALATEVCIPGPIYGDLHDVMTRLTDGGMQLFLATVLGITRGGEFGAEVIDYPGIDAPVTGTGYLGAAWATSGVPPGFTVWTGDLDLPPSTEPDARAEFGVSEGVDPETLDPDGDGLVGAHDNCWGYPNIEQRLSDATRICCMNDGGTTELASTFRPACVEACPQPTSVVIPALDCDSDLLPDVCELDEDGDSRPDDCDNCPSDTNIDQADCNRDAVLEVRRNEAMSGVPFPSQTPIRGDRCDPEPCGETRIIEASSETSGASLFSREVAFDLFQVDARATTARAARTGYRFCRCFARADTPTWRRGCTIAGADFLGDCRMNDLARFGGAVEHRPWRWMSITPTSAEGDPNAPGTEDALPYSPSGVGAFQIDREGRWRVLTHDIPRWATLDGLAEPFEDFTTPDGFAGAIAGVVWTHTPGPAGGGGLFTDAQRALRSHYWSGQLPRPYSTVPFIPRAILIAPIARGGDWYGRLPFVARVPAFRGEPAGPMMMQGTFGIPRTSEMALFEYAGTWVTASEPSSLLPESGLRQVALDPNGAVAMVLGEHEGALLDADAPCQTGQCGNLSGQLLLTPHGTAEPPRGALFAELPPASSSTFVLSATRQQLWRVSGTGSNPASLATYDAASAQWAVQRVTGLGRVLAAVYSPREGVIWVLDEDVLSEPATAGRGRGRRDRLHARLVALGPYTGRSTVVASWRRHTLHDRFGMALDPNGRIYLAASHHAAHVVVLLDPSLEGVTLLGARVGVQAIVPGMMRANADGVALGIDGRLGQSVANYSLRELRPGEMSSCL